ncbi:glycoside hydrolase N-terminal domain-containing protein [Luedemannella helvata]|uniref:Glycoside hydrolase N-terminal domain-containing protein n=1 Tax=Luedemannella helvata TaxID=349315 RepID=A0ABN2KUL3_9ACTN
MVVNGVRVPERGFVSRSPAPTWEHGLITGNGRQGAVVHGTPGAIAIDLAHERLRHPVQAPLDPPPTAEVLPELRRLLRDGRRQEAADLVVTVAGKADPGYAELRWIDPFIGAGTLTLTLDPAADWIRATDFATGLVAHAWHDGRGEVRVETFVSRPHDVVVVRLRADHPVAGTLLLRPVAGEPRRPVAHELVTDRAGLTLRGRFHTGSGYAITTRLRCDGATAPAGDAVRFADVTELVVLARTTVTGHPPPPVAAPAPRDDLDALDALPGGDDLLAAHAAAHGALFGRSRLILGAPAAPSSEELLADPTDPAVIAALYDAGRYAIISSTGELPPALQGVWSGTWHPAWASGYTLDGNLQAAVAALEATGTPELMLPLFDLLDACREDFRRNARRLYGARGILVPAHLGTHGLANHFGPRWCLTFWTAGAAWLARLYADHWRYSGDLAFLRARAYPFMVEAADFYLDFVTIKDGRATFVPSYSPENNPGGGEAQAALDATADVAAVRDLLRNLLAAHGALGLADPRAAAWRALHDALPAYEVRGGVLAEWLHPALRDNHGHRHASHLYGLWYEPDPPLLADPTLRSAAGAAVAARLAWWREQGDEMAFGLVQLGLAAAALGLAEPAYEVLTRLAGRYWRPNLVSTHNAGDLFNVDICGGLPALVVAMLVGAGPARPPDAPPVPEQLRLLPALPAAWPTGEIQGVRARGGVTVERLVWSPDGLTAGLRGTGDVVVHTPWGLPRRVRLTPDTVMTVTVRAGMDGSGPAHVGRDG